ncbi:MAG: phospholipase [Pirellulales bacterium]
MEEELASAKNDYVAARKAVDSKQLQLRDKEDKIATLKARLSACSTNREYQALQEQISADQVATSVLEDEILDSLAKVDERKLLVGKAEQNCAKGNEELQKIRKGVDDQRQLIAGDITRLEAELIQVENELPPDSRVEYTRMVRAKGEEALAEVEGDVCGGCNKQLPPNMISQLKLGKACICKSCGRLIYLGSD